MYEGIRKHRNITALCLAVAGVTAASAIAIAVSSHDDGASPAQTTQSERAPTPSASPTPTFSWVVDPSLVAVAGPLPGIDGAPARPVAVVEHSDGSRDEFAENEVLFKPADQAELDKFLARYGGTILRADSPTAPTDGWYTIRIDPARSTTDDLAASMDRLGVTGGAKISSDAAARLAAVVAREAHDRTTFNFVTQDLTEDHPLAGGGYRDVSTLPYMNSDDDPGVPGDQGLSVSVTRTWDALALADVPDAFYGETVVAIIDSGFALDDTGQPLDGNLDFYHPYMWDVVDDDLSAGGMNTNGCGSAGPCPWHGQSTFSVAAARPDNRFGAAGTGGVFVRPMLIRDDGSYSMMASAIRHAARGASGVDVISISSGGQCGWWCRRFVDNGVEDAIDEARDKGIIVVAAAGNEGWNLDGTTFAKHYVPCEVSGVICVGAIERDGTAKGYSNYGGRVDIWAPTDILTTPDPSTSGATATFGGTSAATPFVAGILGLMKALDPSLNHDRALEILQDTANPSSDEKVTPGYVDAFWAVEGLLPENLSPTIVIDSPADRLTQAAAFSVQFRATATDPEEGRLSGEAVRWTSDLQGLLCTGASCDATLIRGVHTITATASDSASRSDSANVSITLVNLPPADTRIIRPGEGDTIEAGRPVVFEAEARDDDGLPGELRFAWTSSQDGPIGNERAFTAALTEGTHVISVTPTDQSFAAGPSASITLIVKAPVGPGRPTALITSPDPGPFLSPVELRGVATDPEDGFLRGSQLRWYSESKGFLGSGEVLKVELVIAGCEQTDEITLVATDSDGNEARHSIVLASAQQCD